MNLKQHHDNLYLIVVLELVLGSLHGCLNESAPVIVMKEDCHNDQWQGACNCITNGDEINEI